MSHLRRTTIFIGFHGSKPKNRKEDCYIFVISQSECPPHSQPRTLRRCRCPLLSSSRNSLVSPPDKSPTLAGCCNENSIRLLSMVHPFPATIFQRDRRRKPRVSRPATMRCGNKLDSNNSNNNSNNNHQYHSPALTILRVRDATPRVESVEGRSRGRRWDRRST